LAITFGHENDGKSFVLFLILKKNLFQLIDLSGLQLKVL
jgi:hypothetical protein